MSFLRTVTASFDTVDLAELAARNLKRDFRQIKAITIKYRNYPETPHDRQNDAPVVETSPNLAAAAAVNSAGAGIGFGGGGIPALFPAQYDPYQTRYSNQSRPEIELSTESRLIVKAPENLVRPIQSHIRGMGGQQIVVS